MTNHPDIACNPTGFALAFIAAFIFGFLWYAPLFGKKWAELMNFDITQKPTSQEMMRSIALQIIGLLLMICVMGPTIQIWRPSLWGVGTDAPNYVFGFYAAFYTWIGFYVPQQLNKVAWEKRPFALFALNTCHDFLLLQIVAQILAHFH